MIFNHHDLGYVRSSQPRGFHEMRQPSLSQTPERPSAPASRFVAYVLAALSFASVAMLAPACGDTGGTSGTGGGGTGGGDCIGGVVIDGVCQGKCTPDKCKAENTCVDNACLLKCDSHKDCHLDGSQNCAVATEDDSGAAITVCELTGQSAGIGTTCPFGTECTNWLSCADGATCFANQCGNEPTSCVVDEVACDGVEGCTVGKCPNRCADGTVCAEGAACADGSTCTPGGGCRVNCTTDCKAWLECETKGEADADAYCTKRDCASDDDCLGGYYCGIVRDPHEICGSSPKKGDNNFCGLTADPCKSPGQDGSSLFEGSICMLRKSCLKRDRAAPCATDLDCSHIDGQKCVAVSGESRCAPTCSVDANCLPDQACDPALGACVPRFGKWIGEGGVFCEPCVSDEDCGSKGTTWACTEISGGMRACFDQAFPDTCTSNADCPKSPSGKSGTCFDEGEGFDPADSLYHRCYLPINPADNKTSCW